MNDSVFLMNRPLSLLARQTQTDADLLPGQACFERDREGHPGKKGSLSADCLRVSAVKLFA